MAGSQTSVGLRIAVLGPLRITVDGGPLATDTRKAPAMLALLAVEGRPFAREELAAFFWPEAEDEAARGSLRRTLSTLRSALRDRYLVIGRSEVALAREGVYLDLAQLESLAAGGADQEALARAAGLVRGPFMAGFGLRDSPEFDDWRAARASAVEHLVTDLLGRLAAAQSAAGDIAGAIATATRQLELDPLDEPAHRRLIGLLADSGDRGAAVRQYRSCVAVLERELGVPPLAETTALYESIRDGSRPPQIAAVAASADVRRPSPPAPVSPAVEVRPPAGLPFVGRDDEVAQVLEAHDQARLAGSVVVLEGEPGIGKTRLAEVVAERVAAAGAPVLQARAWEAESGIAYGPIADLLRRAVARPEAAARLAALGEEASSELARIVPLPGVAARSSRAADGGDPTLARVRLLDALARALATLLDGPGPGLLVMDDVQWADASTVELLAYLVRHLPDEHYLLLLAWRAEDLGERALPLATLVDRTPGGRVITLGRLDPDAVAALVAAALPPPGGGAAVPARMVESIVEAAEGLPLYLVERLAERPADHPPRTAGAVPHGFRNLLRERLARIGEAAAQVLSAGAVIGRSFDLSTVRAASGRSEDETVEALDELIRRGLLREATVEGELRLDFAHASLREAAYEATSLVRRRLLHRRVADFLRATTGHPAGPGTGELGRLVLVARHERAAGREQEAAEAYRVAAERARDLAASPEAIDLAQNAVALGHPAAAALQRLIGEQRLAMGEYAAAISAFEAAAAHAAGQEAVELELLLGRAHARRGDVAGAASHLDEALAACPAGTAATPDCLRLRIRILVERSAVALRTVDEPRAGAAAEEALRLAVNAGDRAGAGLAHRVLGLLARSTGRLEAARRELSESLAIAEAEGDIGGTVAAGNALALVLAAQGDPRAAIGLLEPVAAASRRLGERHLEAAIESNLADGWHALGDEGRSMEHLRRSVALLAEIGGRPGELEPEVWRLESW